MKKYIKIIILVLLFVFVLFCIFKIVEYKEAKSLCEEIKNGNDITTDFSNGSTAPLFLDNIAKIMQVDGPKIPLIEACYYRNVQSVKVLLENGADPNFYIDGRWSSLEAAFVYGPADERTYEIVQLLMEYGADIDKQHGSYESILHYLSEIIYSGNECAAVHDSFLYLIDFVEPQKYGDVYRMIYKSGNTELIEIMKEKGFDEVG